MDLVGPLRKGTGQKFGGYDYIFTIYDAFSHKLIAEPIKSKEATSVLDAFVKRVVLQGLVPNRIIRLAGKELDRSGKEIKERVRAGRIYTDNGTEFKNELLASFLKQFKVRFGYAIPYHPQGNPVERVHRYAGAVLRIAVARSDSCFDHWSEAVPYAEFSYNKKYIPGTMVSPFMLRNGFQPRYPSDVNRPEYRCENQTYQEKLQEITKRYMEMEKIVSEAHEIAKAKQKVRYDAKQYDVQFKKGDKVLYYHSRVQPIGVAEHTTEAGGWEGTNAASTRDWFGAWAQEMCSAGRATDAELQRLHGAMFESGTEEFVFSASREEVSHLRRRLAEEDHAIWARV